MTEPDGPTPPDEPDAPPTEPEVPSTELDVPPTEPEASRHGRHEAPYARGPGANIRPRTRIGLGVLATILFLACLFGVHTAIGHEHHNDVARKSAAAAASKAAAPAPSTPSRPATTTAGASPKSSATVGKSAADTPWWQLSPSSAAPALQPAKNSSLEPTATGLTALLAPLLSEPALHGETLGVVVSDAVSGSVLFGHQATTGLAPASTGKLATAVAALEVLGPNKRLATTVVQGSTPGQIIIVGGGDPTLSGPAAVGAGAPGFPAPAELSDLAAQTASALKAHGTTTVTLGYDTSLFTGPDTAPGWRPSYTSEGDVAPVSALEVDEGRPDPTRPARTTTPAPLAAADFATLLSADGVKVTQPPTAVKAASGAPTVASVSSPPLSALIERMLGRSDNDIAEALARQVAIAVGQPASFTGGAAAVKSEDAKLGIDTTGLAMLDASGLSHSDRVYPAVLTQLLALALGNQHPELAPILAGLPVAGFSGTLDARYLTGPAAAAAGVVRAKTGTLDGTAALAGYLQDSSGRLLSFALLAGNVPLGATGTTDAALDRVAAGLATCGCAG